jgi:hypothetical protein
MGEIGQIHGEIRRRCELLKEAGQADIEWIAPQITEGCW